MAEMAISLSAQTLWLRQQGQVVATYAVSTAKNGAGEQMGSGCTPRGWHRIRAKIGAGLPRGAVLVGRRWTGEIHDAALQAQFPERDWILSRILWLCGEEVGRNRLGACDTQRRFIYLHGCPDGLPMGVPLSHGCVRLTNDDMIDLFARVAVGTRVNIVET